MNLSKELKKKRDAEARLNRQSPQPTFTSDGTTDAYIDISGLATKSELTAGLADKSDTNHAHEITELTDVSIAYTGNSGKVLKVNATESGMELGEAGGGGAFAFEIGADGHLYVLYDEGSTAPDYEIDASGHLILDLGAVI